MAMRADEVVATKVITEKIRGSWWQTPKIQSIERNFRMPIDTVSVTKWRDNPSNFVHL